jgi:hypothetical protein
MRINTFLHWKETRRLLIVFSSHELMIILMRVSMNKNNQMLWLSDKTAALMLAVGSRAFGPML